MKILFIDFTLPYLLKDSSYPVGGWEVELNAWIKWLRVNSHQVGVLCGQSPEEFYEGMIKLISNFGKYKKNAEKAKEYIFENYNYVKMREKVDFLYREMLSKSI